MQLGKKFVRLLSVFGVAWESDEAKTEPGDQGGRESEAGRRESVDLSVFGRRKTEEIGGVRE